MLKETQLDQVLELYPVLLDVGLRLRQELTVEGAQLEMPPGRVLFEVDTPCTQFLLVTMGSLRVVKAGVSGREVLLYRVQPGEVCLLTLSGLLEGTAYVAKGIVEMNLTAVGISRRLFLSMLDQSPSFRLFVLRSLTRRMFGFISLVEEILFGRLDQRLAALLLSKGMTIQTTHQGLADELGSTREAVSRTLESLEEQGIVVLERGRITIIERAALKKICGSAL